MISRMIIMLSGRIIMFSGMIIMLSGMIIMLSGMNIMLCGMIIIVPRRLFFAAQQRIAITWRPKYYKKMRCFITRRNQKEYGPDVM
jgi:hypothetical protein